MRALETSQFHVADAAALLVQDPTMLLYVAALARRLLAANQAFIELRSRLQAGQPHSAISEAMENVEGALYRYFRLWT